MLKRVQQSGASITPTESLEDYGLGGVDCEICGNTGHVLVDRDGQLYSRECECMAKRRSLRKLRNSGMMDMVSRYTFDNYATPDLETADVKRMAQGYTDGWLYIFGRSGSGKTHICTAICSELINRGEEVYYMSWRDESTTLKGMVTDAEGYEKRLNKIKRVPVLYIDDFLKGGASDADIRLAFEILNARYNDSKLKTIISSEMDLTAVLNRDEALGGRIYERAKKNVLRAPGKNWRLR